MSGGGSKSSGSSAATVQAPMAALPPVTAPTFAANTAMPVGYQFPQNPGATGSASTGIGTGAPDWAQGAWAMPWWGQSAPQTGQAMLQAQQQGAYAPMTAAPAQAAPAQAAPAPTQGPAQDPAQRQYQAIVNAGYTPEVAQAILSMGGLETFKQVPGLNVNEDSLYLGKKAYQPVYENQFWGNPLMSNTQNAAQATYSPIYSPG